MTAADKLRDLHSRLTRGTAVEQLLGQDEIEDALPEIAAVINAGRHLADAAMSRSRIPHDRPTDKDLAQSWESIIVAYQSAIEAYDNAEAALNARLDGAA